MVGKVNNTFSLRDYCDVLFRYKKSIIVLVLSTLFTVVVGVYNVSPIFEAKSKILVKLGRENVTIPTVPSAQQQVFSSGLRMEDTNSEIEVIENRFIIEKVVEKLGVDFLNPTDTEPDTFFEKVKYYVSRTKDKIKDSIYKIFYTLGLKTELPPFEDAVMNIQKGLLTKQIKNSDVIEVYFRWFCPDIATEVLSTLIDFYLEHHLHVHKSAGGYDIFQQQVEVIGNRLKESEERLQLLKEINGITSYKEQQSYLLQQLNSFKTDLKNTETEIAETGAKKSELEKQLSSQFENIQLTKEVNRNPVIDKLKIKLVELELEKKRLEKKYQPGTPPLVFNTEEIQKIKSKLDDESNDVVGAVRTGANKIYVDTREKLISQEVKLNSLIEKKEKILQHIRSYQDNLERLNKYNLELTRLNRQIGIDEKDYILYLNHLEKARISGVLDREKIVNVKVIAPAKASYIPVRPKRLRLIAVGLLLSLVVGIGFAFVSNYFDHSIKTEDDVKRYLKLPVLESIKEIGPDNKTEK